jgi:flavorubredoxin
MSAIKMKENVYWVGVKDPGLIKFDIYMDLRQGTTYNSYLIKGEKITLIDAAKKEFITSYFDSIRQIVPLDRIDYLVVNHTEPDHSGAITALLKENPKIELICAAAAIPFVKNVINADIPLRGVKDNDTLDLGVKKLTFKIMPYMHWPDTMMEYLDGEGILFSCDGFATHWCGDTLYSDEIKDDFDHEFHYYWDSIMRPFSTYIRRNLTKLDSLDLKMIAPSHGPVIRDNPHTYIDKYKEWVADKTEKANQVTIFYASSYGNTKFLAEKIAENISRGGFNTVLFDAAACPVGKARDNIEKSRAVLFGTPTFNGDAVKPIWDIVGLLNTVGCLGKKAAVFGSYGWSGEGIELVSNRLSGMRMKVFNSPIKARLIPSDAELSQLDEYCTGLIDFIKK